MLRRLFAFILSFVIVMGVARPAVAITIDPSVIKDGLSTLTQRSGQVLKDTSGLVTKCFLETPENGLEEVSCNLLKSGVETGVVIVSCYIASTAATTVFPPAAAVTPLCSSVGIGGEGVEKGLKFLIH